MKLDPFMVETWPCETKAESMMSSIGQYVEIQWKEAVYNDVEK